MSKPRRSTSGETRQYIDHLEAELSRAQAERDAPSVAREQFAKIRMLKIETKRQQKELADWDKNYEDRLQEEVDRHHQLELSLRSRLRSVEAELATKTFRISELECAVESARQTTEAVEAANTKLEKRLEIMSGLLAESPTKLELHIDASGHTRNKSVLPRLPAVGPMMSPERPSFSLPAKPDIQPGPPSPYRRSTPTKLGLHINAFAHTRHGRNKSVLPRLPAVGTMMSHKRPSFASSANSGIQPCSPSPYRRSTPTKLGLPIDHNCDESDDDMHPMPFPPIPKNPSRRMRRFVGGNLALKPLILPSTSYHQPAQNDGTSDVHSNMEAGALSDDPTTPRQAHSNEAAMDEHHSDDELLDRFVEMARHHPVKTYEMRTPSTGRSEMPDVSSEVSCTYSRNFSSLGSMELFSGPTLLEELGALNSSAFEYSSVFDSDAESQTCADGSQGHNPSPPPRDRALSISPTPALLANTSLVSNASTLVSTASIPGTILRAYSPHSLSTIDSVGSYFSNLVRSPIVPARHLVETAQTRARLPRPFFSIQWWLVGLLIGPMAKRELLRTKELSQSSCDRDTGRTSNELSQSSCDRDTGLSANELSQSSCDRDTGLSANELSQSSCDRDTGLSANELSQSSASKSVAKRCPHYKSTKRFKHSPWLWLKFSFTLAVAVGVAFKEGPGSLLKEVLCACGKN